MRFYNIIKKLDIISDKSVIATTTHYDAVAKESHFLLQMCHMCVSDE